MKPFKSKTVWTGITAIIGALAAGATGTIDHAQAASLIIEGLTAVFLRLAVSKATGAPLDPPTNNSDIGSNGAP